MTRKKGDTVIIGILVATFALMGSVIVIIFEYFGNLYHNVLDTKKARIVNEKAKFANLIEQYKGNIEKESIYIENYELKLEAYRTAGNNLLSYTTNLIAKLNIVKANNVNLEQDINHNKNALKSFNLQVKANDYSYQEKTKALSRTISEIEDILLYPNTYNNNRLWEVLTDYSNFDEPNPKDMILKKLSEIEILKSPDYFEIPIKPSVDDELFKQKHTLSDKASTFRKKKKTNNANQRFEIALKLWEDEKNRIELINSELMFKYNSALDYFNSIEKELSEKYAYLEGDWFKRQADFYLKKEDYNKELSDLKMRYYDKEPQAIIKYCSIILSKSRYPFDFHKSNKFEYNENNKSLLVEYQLPAIVSLPKLKELKFIKSSRVIKKIAIPIKELKTIYNSTIYKITLRTLFELFHADSNDYIDLIVFNGWVNTINKSTGKEQVTCIVSISAKKEELMEIDLKKVDPKSCFKSFKGISCSDISDIIAIQPLQQIEKSDKRFIDSKVVEFDNSTNLAAMDWEDFEHLIREIFEEEFTINGGEVNVTKASRDGGVDAIAFDPDPIRGGKIVIQAKRYTNTVGVSAVRDLYGTVLNEGANKGILVTTSDYGADSYEFAKGKPITLLNGSNLLYLLEKHGHHARIDIKEAKNLFFENNKELL